MAVIDTLSTVNNRRYASATICHSEASIATVTGSWEGNGPIERAHQWQPVTGNLTCPLHPFLSSPLLSSYLIFLYHSQDWMKAGRFFFFSSPPHALRRALKSEKKSQPTHLNFGAVNNWASSRVPPRWGQLLESQREAVEKSSFIMKAQREPSVLMTNKPNEVCSPLHPAPPSLPPPLLSDSECSRVARSNVRRRLSATGMTRWRVWGERWREDWDKKRWTALSSIPHRVYLPFITVLWKDKDIKGSRLSLFIAIWRQSYDCPSESKTPTSDSLKQCTVIHLEVYLLYTALGDHFKTKLAWKMDTWTYISKISLNWLKTIVSKCCCMFTKVFSS